MQSDLRQSGALGEIDEEVGERLRIGQRAVDVRYDEPAPIGPRRASEEMIGALLALPRAERRSSRGADRDGSVATGVFGVEVVMVIPYRPDDVDTAGVAP